MMMTHEMLKKELADLDVIAVQSSGLRKLSDGTYASTLYTDTDDFGMLGGYVRLLAAEELYWQKPTAPFVFCNGKSAKQIAKFGPDVPVEADVHAEEFRRGLSLDERTNQASTPEPQIYLEGTSVNTVASISNLVAMCKQHGWKRMGIISSDYHIPRIEALCRLVLEKLGETTITVSCLSAESILKALRPGVYDDEIAAAYNSPAGQERLRNERKGCEDIAAGRYHIGEFQLAADESSTA